MSVRKDLGMVTAYAYAVSKGYAGTEEEFATLMASYADVGQAAVDAALAAKASEDAAKASETAAEASKTAAATSAGTATTAAQTATGAAQTATTKASEATTAATTATTKAAEAAQSATQAAASATAAGTSATAAQTAQTAAETAQGKAEDAQAAAEAAAQTLVIDPTLTQANQAAEAKATGDAISLLKSHLNATEIVDTASGAIATFPDGSDGVPVESLTVQMEPIQDLHGQDAPYPAGGGKNLLNVAESTEVRKNGGASFTLVYSADNSVTMQTTTTGSLYVVWQAFVVTSDMVGKSITLSFTISGASSSVRLMGTTNADGDWISTAPIELTVSASVKTYTILDTDVGRAIGVRFINTSGANLSVSKLQVEFGSSETAFTPYSNICPISGRQSVTVWRSGVNLFDAQAFADEYGCTFENDVLSKSTSLPNLTPMWVNTKLQAGYVTASCIFGTEVYANRTFIIRFEYTDGTSSTWYPWNDQTVRSFTSNGKTVARVVTSYSSPGAWSIANMMIEFGATASAYKRGDIQSIEIPLGQTVYGGTVDVTTGEMVVDRTMFTPNSAIAAGTNPITNWIFSIANSPSLANNSGKITSNYFVKGSLAPGKCYITNNGIYIVCAPVDDTLNTVALVNAWLAEHDLQFCYELATPVTVQLSAEQLTTVLGTNNVWSDANSVSVDYVADTKLFIEQLTEPDADMVADANITSGKYFMVGNQLFLATANIASGAVITPGVNCTRTSLAAALNAINS